MKEPSRKFTDLIFRASSKYGNWDPPKPIQVGDYGKINSATGQFEKEGNIYEDPETAALAAKNPPQSTFPQRSMTVTSKAVSQHELTVGPEVSVAGLLDASVKGSWEFGDDSGALLIMDKPRISFVPPKVLLKHLVDIKVLQGKSLVTEVVTCPAYSLYLSNGSKHKVSVALVAKAPIPAAPGVSAGGKFSSEWWSQNLAGLFQDACDDTGSYSFSPLYTLSAIRKKGFFSRDGENAEIKDDDHWVPAELPWDELDEEGEDISFQDLPEDE